ncbi:MAG TPA: aminotransferase class V-fold PLP-dependent enzyme, partial [Holophaga sp.]|nr:aminotransferase class V-fold PLP-dependent enzyme [Holophaga sp.]
MIYLDHNATTPVAPSVLEAMLPWFELHFGNPSSPHAAGRRAAGALDHAREQVAGFLGCGPEEVVFTSGGTEAINLALRGVFEARPARRHLVTTAVEHSAVLAVTAWLKAHGAEVTFLGVDGEGGLDLAELQAALRPDTALVSLTAAHHETGVRFPVAEAASLARARGALLHVDAVQAAGKEPLDVAAWGADLLSLGAHKFN